MRKIGKKKLVVGAAAIAIVAAGAGTALAYWSTTGTGTGTATTGSSSAFVVTITNSDVKNLTPGGPKQTVHFNVHNSSTGHQFYGKALPTVIDTSNSGCTAGDFDISGLTTTYGDLASGGDAAGTFDLQMVNDQARNQDACQNVTVNLQVVASSS
jgi:hypothetical protein